MDVIGDCFRDVTDENVDYAADENVDCTSGHLPEVTFDADVIVDRFRNAIGDRLHDANVEHVDLAQGYAWIVEHVDFAQGHAWQSTFDNAFYARKVADPKCTDIDLAEPIEFNAQAHAPEIVFEHVVPEIPLEKDPIDVRYKIVAGKAHFPKHSEKNAESITKQRAIADSLWTPEPDFGVVLNTEESANARFKFWHSSTSSTIAFLLL